MKAYILTNAAKIHLKPYGVLTKGDVVEDVPESVRHYFNECEVGETKEVETAAETESIVEDVPESEETELNTKNDKKLRGKK